MMRRLWKCLKLAFDRSFSGASWKQIAWMVCILALVFAFALWVESRCALELHDMRILELLLDPGSFVLQEGDPQGHDRLPLLILTFLGTVFFTGGVISVVSNILTGRIGRFRQGEIRYRFDGHIVLLGANEMAAGLIRELHAETSTRRRDIVLLTQSPVDELRQTLHTRLSPDEERRLVLLHGQRDSYEELERIHVDRAECVFLLGDEGEQEHDSVSINALMQIRKILDRQRRTAPLPCHLWFEYQSSFQIFQLADFEEAERMKQRIHLSATNFHENWAQRVLVSGHCGCDDRCIDYPPLDGSGIGADSDRHVHLIVVGMSRMGIAMGITGAHIAHYPNFDTRGIRTRITFIDPDAEREMNFLKGRYEPLFRLSHHTLRRPGGKEGETVDAHVPQEDFLDVEWEFVAAGIESDYVRDLLRQWAADESALPTLAFCGNSAPENIAAALYLPPIVYDRRLPIFVYQRQTATILDIARRSERYRNIHPFGMMTESYDAALKRRIDKAMRINYIYETYYNSPEEEFRRILAQPWPEEKLRAAWASLSLTFQWSNIYAANIIPSKLRSLGIDPAAVRPLDESEVEIAARVEHNRWNIERLLTGYRPATPAERERAEKDSGYNRRLKNERFVHINIVPYDEIPESTKEIDRILTRYLHRIER